MRTDDNHNPTAFTTDVAHEAGLVSGVDYESGTTFPAPSKLVTAKILGDPIGVTIRVIDSLGFYTKAGTMRWNYIAMPLFTWLDFTSVQARDVIGFMYQREGGTTMRHLFPNYGRR